jgi:hypothetical protein
MKATVVKELMRKYNIPEHMAVMIVDAEGSIDKERLQIALSGVGWGQQPGSKASPELVSGLITALKDATARRDAGAIISLRSSLAKIGVLNPEL